MNKKLILFICAILALTQGCANKRIGISNTPEKDCRYFKQTIYETRSATVFVHGTLYPLVDIFIHAFDCPLGLVPATMQGNKFIHGKIPYILNKADHTDFCIDSFYLFGWSGKLSFDARRKAANQLYDSLKHFTGPLTVIGHSHGANVALLLAEIAQERQDRDFIVDRLILLACPVQHITEDLVCSPVFKKIYSFYSIGDWTQVKDLQGFYRVTGEHIRKTKKKLSVFSKRVFVEQPNLVQMKCLIGRRHARHLDFIYKPFLSRLPQIISLADKSIEQGYIDDSERQYSVNVPESGCPQLLVKKSNKFVVQDLCCQ